MASLVGRRDKNAAQAIRGSRVAVAIAIGILLGGIFAFLYPHGFLSSNHASPFQGRRLAKSILQIGSTYCESSERVNMLKSELAEILSENNELKKQVRDLTKKLMAAEQKNGNAEQQVVVGKPQKAGPFGTLKGIRTNPVVLPDYTVNPRLAKILKNVAVQNELIVALANTNVKAMLEVWFTSIKKVGIPNYLVVALDDGIVDFCKENGVPFYKRDPDADIDSVAKTGGNHAVSGLKFRILREFLQLGYSVLLSDVDIVYLQNPFDHLYRDSDVESMSDGHNNMTAYGYNDVSDDPSMGWARYAHTMRIWVYNSGFFYLRPTLPAIELLDRVADRLSHPPPAWDQAVFNEELFFPSYPDYIGLHASKRTMDRYMFMNSKTLFKEVRKDGDLKKLKPVIVHLNYHPDKLPRMIAVMEFYFNGKQDALEPFPDGSECLPSKMTKTVDIPVFGSNVHTPSTPLSRFLSPATQGRDVFRGQSPGQTMLSRESSAKESLFSTQSTENGLDHKSMNRTTKTGSPSSEFHFSIHKWANVGVPLLMSLREGIHPTFKGSSKVSALQDSGFPNEDLSAEKEDKNPISGISLMKAIEKETSMVKQEVSKPEVMPPSSLLHDEIERQGYEAAGREAEGKENMETMSGKKKPESKKKKGEANKPVVGSPKSSPKNRVKGMVKDFFKISTQESPPKTKTNVSSRWKTSARNRTQEEVTDIMSNLDNNVEMKPDASKTTKLASEMPTENVKIVPDASKATKLASKLPAENVKIAPVASKATKLASKLPAENVKIAPDASKTSKLASKLPAENVNIAPNSSSTTPLDSKVTADNVNMMPDASFMVKEQFEKSNKPKFPQNRTIRKLEDINFQKNASPASVPYGSKPSVENIDDPSLDNFQIEELAPVEDKLSNTQQESEAIMALDSKIHLWSSGRKGNIRSLLSTLQVVLWADSGWKPVALVDIIEANAVKKAYNRAMLCLHPDKLQQKGADSHKKYIAEKVFDILQEAWDHFNSLGTLV